MQDRYAGDVGDFGKYALLNRLCAGDGNGGSVLDLGVLWYRFTDDEPGAQTDGKHIGYLQPRKCEEFRRCDPGLWEKMHKVVYGHRSIAEVEASGALPAKTAYYSTPLSFGCHELHAVGQKRTARQKKRCAWLQAGRDAVAGADLIFVDPDNGFASKGVKPHHQKGPKYVFCCDLNAHVDAGQSLVVYYHLGRNKSHDAQISDWLDTLSKRFGHLRGIFALRYRRGTARAYFVLPGPKHAKPLAARAQTLTASDSLWRKHFDHRIYWP